MNPAFLYLIIKIVCLAACGMLLLGGAKDAGSLVIGLLAFCCVFMVQFLAGALKQRKWEKWTWLVMLAAWAGCIWYGTESFLALTLIVVWELIDFFTGGRLFHQLAVVAAVFLWLVYPAGLENTVVCLIAGGLFCFVRGLNLEVIRQKEAVQMQKEELAVTARKLEDMKNYAKTVRDTVSMEERNRFAARIHDQLGHNISGSIILLEATVLSMDKDPQGAKRNMEMVAANLRKGVDDIRLSLRQERPDRSKLGIHEIRRQMEEFMVTYGTVTRLDVEGDVDRIAASVWICIQENLKEALTNVLKHSKGNEFRVHINSMNRILRVEFADNGEASGEIGHGIGLAAMEERTAACGGNCMVHAGRNGFMITHVFVDV